MYVVAVTITSSRFALCSDNCLHRLLLQWPTGHAFISSRSERLEMLFILARALLWCWNYSLLLNASACLIGGIPKFHHVPTYMCDSLHLLPIPNTSNLGFNSYAERLGWNCPILSWLAVYLCLVCSWPQVPLFVQLGCSSCPLGSFLYMIQLRTEDLLALVLWVGTGQRLYLHWSCGLEQPSS